MGKELTSQKAIGFQILAVIAFLSLRFLLDGNMGKVNEVDILPFVRQHADPTWIPGDWYLNQPAGYRLPFIALFGNLAVAWGFVATSVIGRLLCYSLIASGLVFLGRKLGLSLLSLLLAVGLFVYANPSQGAVAHEWLVGGLEPKSVAYGLLLLAIGLLLEGRYRWMALLLGLATTFHVLVGGWAFLTVIGWLLLRRRNDVADIRDWGAIVLIYLAGSAFAIWTMVEHLFAPTPTGSVSASYVYVFLRSPHHLNPLAWEPDWWIVPMVYLLVLGLSVAMLRRKQQSEQLSEQHTARLGLAEFTLLALVPFIFGLAIAPFDSQGKLLQYYPFRLGDIMLPLNTCLLFACALQQTFTGKAKRVFLLLCIVLLSLVCSIQSVSFYQALSDLRQFPSKEQGVNPEWKALCAWVRTHTPENAIVVSPPDELTNFTWVAERPTIAKFKLIPPTAVGVMDWYERLSDLSGDVSPWPSRTAKNRGKGKISRALTAGYNSLKTNQAQTLMDKYRADYFVTRVEHQLDLPIAYRNSLYVLYGKTPS